MSYDLDFRFRRALYPEGLMTFDRCLEALEDASRAARKAGHSASQDPAVQLFARQLSQLSNGQGANGETRDADLRRDCRNRIEQIEAESSIVDLLLKGVSHDADDLRAYRRDGQKALRAIAHHLGYERGTYRLTYSAGNPTIPGDHILETDDFFIRLSPECWGAPALSYRHPRWAAPGRTIRHARAGDLRDTGALADRIANDLHLTRPEPQLSLI